MQSNALTRVQGNALSHKIDITRRYSIKFVMFCICGKEFATSNSRPIISNNQWDLSFAMSTTFNNLIQRKLLDIYSFLKLDYGKPFFFPLRYTYSCCHQTMFHIQPILNLVCRHRVFVLYNRIRLKLV